MRLKALSVTAGLVLAVAAGSAPAFVIPTGIPGIAAGAQLEDDDRDYHLSSTGVVKSGPIVVGDMLFAPLEISKIIDLLPPIGPTQDLSLTPEELTAVAVIKVIALLGTDPAGRIRFGAPSAAEWLAATGFAQPAAGAMVASFIGTGLTNDLDIAACTTRADCTTKATNGAPWMVWGIDGSDADDEWFFDPLVTGAGDSSVVATLPAATKVGVANFALTAILTAGLDVREQLLPCAPSLFACAGDGKTDVLGSADILGGLLLPSGFARSDADALLNVVPEPATLALLGIGLLGVAAALRRRPRRS